MPILHFGTSKSTAAFQVVLNCLLMNVYVTKLLSNERIISYVTLTFTQRFISMLLECMHSFNVYTQCPFINEEPNWVCLAGCLCHQCAITNFVTTWLLPLLIVILFIGFSLDFRWIFIGWIEKAVAVVSVFFICVSVLSFCLKTHPSMRVPVLHNITIQRSANYTTWLIDKTRTGNNKLYNNSIIATTVI